MSRLGLPKPDENVSLPAPPPGLRRLGKALSWWGALKWGVLRGIGLAGLVLWITYLIEYARLLEGR